MTLDRTKAPVIKPAEEFQFLRAKTAHLQNGVPFYSIHKGDQKILRLDLVFNAGSIVQPKPLLASVTNKLLLEGTKRLNALEIARLIDGKGAFIETNASLENASITLYCLSKDLQELLNLLAEVLETATYPEKEVSEYLEVKRQQFKVNFKKVGFLAKNEFSELLFGKESAYCNKVNEEDFTRLERQELLAFYKQYYQKGDFEVFAAGNVDDNTIKIIDKILGHQKYSGEVSATEVAVPLSNNKGELIFMEQEDALQSAIRLGKLLPSKIHEDFIPLYICNVILGGYFGSRLMSNIREDKGYTYGIGSGIMSHKDISYLAISTEVGAGVTNQTLNEVRFELDRLSSELVPEKEMSLVRNYLKGSLMRGFDGAFAAMDRFRMLKSLGLDYTYYEALIHATTTISANEIQKVARDYLDYETMKIIIVGKR
jgi:predicted Zn-dependent peptidase